jgi:hypothetical protein
VGSLYSGKADEDFYELKRSLRLMNPKSYVAF